MLYAIMKAATAVVCGLLFRLEGRGAENVPKTGPVLVVTNHSSVLDPPAVGALVPRPLYYLS